MRTYIEIVGENPEPAIKALENIAVETPQVCVMDTVIDQVSLVPDFSTGTYEQWVRDYFGLKEDVDAERCANIVSRSGADLGTANLYFEWLTPPDRYQLKKLKDRIDSTMKTLGYKYKVTDRK